MRVKLAAMGYGFFVPSFFITAGASLAVDAIFAEEDLPEAWTEFTAVNEKFFASD